MTREADRIARGDYDVSFPAMPKDVLGQLADSLASLAKQLAADMDRIRRLEITRRDFVANVTHELRTPIAAISGYAETLASGRVEPEKAAQFADMMPPRPAISALVDGLSASPSSTSSLARRRRVSPSICSPRQHVSDTFSSRQRRGRDHELRVPRQTHAATAGRLEQVIENLVDNAIKYAKTGGHVVVSAERDGDEIAIAVSDDGPGIPPEHRDRVFERFYRVDVGRSREKGGAGLGLSIVKHLVESMAGRISLVGAQEGGARVEVRLQSAPPLTRRSWPALAGLLRA
jgi:two-component system phosphate regulon sensor histidine kinase PhoR